MSDLPDMEELSRMTPDEFIKTLEKTISDKTKRGCRSYSPLEQEELRDNQEQDPTSEAPVSQYILLHFAFFEYPASSCLFQNGDLPSRYL